jgi:hypothetical protein
MKVYTLHGIDRKKWKDNQSRRHAGDISTFWSWADLEIVAHSNILIGSTLSNFMRMAQELRATRYGLASNLVMDVGELRCLTMAHCEGNGFPWEFDFYIKRHASWNPFEIRDFPRKLTGEALTEAFRRKLASPDVLPSSIDAYLSVAGKREQWA